MTEPFPNTGRGPSERNPVVDPIPDLFGDSDPLLETGWFIDPEAAAAEPMQEPQPEAAGAESTNPAAPGAASPIMVTPVSQRRPKKPVDESGSWLPEGWTMEVKVRTSGATAGTSDRYFISPTGQKFRSKVEVQHYLETGSKRKIGRKSKTDSDTTQSESPSHSSDKKRKKSKGNPRDFSGLKFDFENPPQRVTWVRGDDNTDDWTPSTSNRAVPESVKAEWANIYSRVTQLEKSK